MSGVGVVTNGGANAADFIGGDAHTHAAAADQHATLGFVVSYGVADEFSEVWIVGRVFVESADVQNVMAECTHHIAHFAFEGKASVVGTDDDFHLAPYLPPDLALAITSLAAATIASGSKPNFFCSSLSGAEAPKVRMPIMRPPGPTYLSQPIVPACSTETRAVIDGGNTLSRYSCGWCSKISHEGMLTRRAFTPSATSFS